MFVSKLSGVLTFFKHAEPQEAVDEPPMRSGYCRAHIAEVAEANAKWEALRAKAAPLVPVPEAGVRRASTGRIPHCPTPVAPRHTRHGSERSAPAPERSQSMLVRRLSRHKKEDAFETLLENTSRAVCKAFDVLLTPDEIRQAARAEGIPLETKRDRQAVSEQCLFEAARKVAMRGWEEKASQQPRIVTDLSGKRAPVVRVATPITRAPTPPLSPLKPALPPRNPRRLSQSYLLTRDVRDLTDAITRGWNRTPDSTVSGSIYTQRSAAGSVVSMYSQGSAKSYHVGNPSFAD